MTKGVSGQKNQHLLILQIIISNIKDEAQVALGESLYKSNALSWGGCTSWMIRKDRFGAKMKDYELDRCIPHAVVIGKKTF